VLRDYRVQRSGLTPTAFEALCDALLRSDFVASSTLSGPFESSRGFGMTFTETGRAQVIERFPALSAWFTQVLGVPALRALTPFWRRPPERTPNAWYLNLLVVPAGGSVARHIDATLRRASQVDDAVPEVVSVLYLQVPSATGGQLKLWQGPIPLGLVRPKVGLSVHFRGDLAHAVLPFEGPPGALRASLVIEQYHFAADALANVPPFHFESRAPFAVHLEGHAAREPTPFELEP